MRKIAIFVEGQTELIFVREFLLNWYDYSIDLECRCLLVDDNLGYIPYPFPNSTAAIHVQIIDAGGDNKILSRMLKRQQSMFNAGYEIIIGLRDMYLEDYKQIVKNRVVDLSVNERFRERISQTISDNSEQPDRIRFCFAVMEIEAWWLGIPSLWTGLNATLFENHRGYFEAPETAFHPAPIVGKLRESIGEIYTKRSDEVDSIVGRLQKEHYIELHESQRCPSFCEFVNYIQTP